MARCEDYPCCGHDICPDFDEETGEQLNMRCVCGAVLPVDNPSSLCDSCLRRGDPEDGGYDDYYGTWDEAEEEDWEDEEEDWEDDEENWADY